MSMVGGSERLGLIAGGGASHGLGSVLCATISV